MHHPNDSGAGTPISAFQELRLNKQYQGYADGYKLWPQVGDNGKYMQECQLELK